MAVGVVERPVIGAYTSLEASLAADAAGIAQIETEGIPQGMQELLLPNKNGLIVVADNTKDMDSFESTGEGYGRLRLIFGTLVHYRVALEHGVGIKEDDVVTFEDAVELQVAKQYEERPEIFWHISEAGAVVSKKIDEMEAPAPGIQRRASHEVVWKLGEDSRKAAETLWDWLKDEQTDRVMGRSTSHDLELALQSSPFFYEHDASNPEFRSLVERIVGRDYTSDDVIELAHKARTHRLVLDRKLLMAQSAKADEILIENDDFDYLAGQIADAFKEVLDSKHSYDPEYLANCLFEIRRTPDSEPKFMNGNEIVYRTAELITTDRIRTTLFDLKSHFHLESGASEDQVWDSEEINRDASKIFTDELVFSAKAGLEQLQKLMYRWQYDAVKTSIVFENIFRVNINEFLMQTGERDPAVGDIHSNATFSFARLVSKLGISLYIADMDLRKGRKLAYHDPRIDELYDTDYPLDDIGIPAPENISVVRVDIPRSWANSLEEKWRQRVRQIGEAAGRVAVAANVLIDDPA